MHGDSKIKRYECVRDKAMIKMNASNQIAKKITLTLCILIDFGTSKN